MAETFGFGLAIHSDRELGIGMTASLNLWATTPALCHKYDSHYPFQVDDIITQPLKWKDGSVSLPKGPGLGVEIDREKLEKYHGLDSSRAALVNMRRLKPPFVVAVVVEKSAFEAQRSLRAAFREGADAAELNLAPLTSMPRRLFSSARPIYTSCRRAAFMGIYGAAFAKLPVLNDEARMERQFSTEPSTPQF